MELLRFICFYFADPRCHLKSFEREQCGDLKGPFVTPDKCIKAGCCYDDMFMDEPSLQWHSQNASIWCFKMKNILSNGKKQSFIENLLCSILLAVQNTD